MKQRSVKRKRVSTGDCDVLVAVVVVEQPADGGPRDDDKANPPVRPKRARGLATKRRKARP